MKGFVDPQPAAHCHNYALWQVTKGIMISGPLLGARLKRFHDFRCNKLHVFET